MKTGTETKRGTQRETEYELGEEILKTLEWKQWREGLLKCCIGSQTIVLVFKRSRLLRSDHTYLGICNNKEKETMHLRIREEGLEEK